MKRGKKYQEKAKLVERSVLYDVNEAIELVQKSTVAKFDETVEAHIKLGVDSRYAEQQVRVQLSNSLVAVFSQTLLPLLQADGTKSGRVMAQEVMLVIPAIANLIREAKAAQIYSTMQTNSGFGMQTLEMSLRDLYLRKKITLEDALARSSRPEEFKRGLQNS